MSINAEQKHIYNCYLSSLARGTGRPFRYRDNFEDFPTDKTLSLAKLETFFKGHPHINISLFMEAPYKIYRDKAYYGLEFYSKPLALKTYFLYINLLDTQNPDEHENLVAIKNGILFIKQFCIENGIPFQSYINHSKEVTYSWGKHLLSQDITIYNLLAFSFFGINIYMLVNRMPSDERELFLNQYNDNLSEYMKKLNNSEKAKVLLLNGYKKIEKIIERDLKNKSFHDTVKTREQP